MPSTTVEKSLFIIFGLAIFSAIGIPIFNKMQEIISTDAVTRDFDSVTNKIELGLRVVENDGCSAFSASVTLFDGLAFELIEDSWGIKAEYVSTRVQLVKSIYSRTCPLTLLLDHCQGTCLLVIEKINGHIVIRFVKEAA